MRRLLVVSVVALLTSVWAPTTFAAQRVVDVRMHNFDVMPPLFVDTVCGVSATFQSTWSFGSSSVVAWDNGHFRTSFNFRDSIADSVTGVVIARASVVHAESEGPGSLPVNVKHHVTARCTPASGMPGHSITISFGFTINERGELTHFHEKITEH